ncbi:MAG: preprotein translocase subunit SecA, partial [Micrococcales bacterium]|nr:preprotein translocase subunit SecA [Micrococcales bacterium]
RLFNSGLAESMMSATGFPEDMPLESKMVTRGIRSAQAQVESRNFEIRKNVLKYDDVMNRQREVIYTQRRQVLEGDDLHEEVTSFREDVLRDYIVQATGEGHPEDWDMDALWTALRTVYPVSITTDEVLEQVGGLRHLTAESLEREVLSDATVAYGDRETELGAEQLRELERRVTLSVLDRKWREHLYEMDYLKEGIGLRAMAQRDPLIEYQREGYQLFSVMIDAIKEETTSFLFNLQVQVADAEPQDEPEEAPSAPGQSTPQMQVQPLAAAAPRVRRPAPRLVAKGLDGPDRQAPLQYSAPNEDGNAETSDGVGRVRSPRVSADGGGANREARRRAAKQARRKR